MKELIGRKLPATTLIRAVINDGAALYLALNIAVAFSHSHLQEDKGKVRKARQEREDKRNIFESIATCILANYNLTKKKVTC